MSTKNEPSKWDKLSTEQRASLIREYVKNGVRNLDQIKEHYNTFSRVQKPKYTPFIGEIKVDDRSKLKKVFDNLATKYNTSNFANSAVAEVLSATTPYGLIHEGLRGNADAAILSIVPFGATIKNEANLVRSFYKGWKAFKNIKNTKLQRLSEETTRSTAISLKDLNAQINRLEEFRDYLTDPEISKKIPVFYKERLKETLDEISSNIIFNKSILRSFRDPTLDITLGADYITKYLGEKTAIKNLKSNILGQYKPYGDIIELDPIKVFTKNNLSVWPHELNHFLDFSPLPTISSFNEFAFKAPIQLAEITPRTNQYLESLINPYKYTFKDYYLDKKMSPIQKVLYELNNSNFGKKLNTKRLFNNKDFIKNYKKLHKKYEYFTDPSEVRAYLSDPAQQLWKKGKETGKSYKLYNNVEWIKTASPHIDSILDFIPDKKIPEFLKNFDKYGFYKGGFLRKK